MQDVELGETTCTDQDEAEERDVVHHELRQLQSDASWTSVDETLDVRSVVLARLQVYQGLESYASWTSVDETLDVRSVVLARLQVYQGLESSSLVRRSISFFSCLSCPCHETVQVYDQRKAEPSRQKHYCQRQENSLCLS